jgi:DMSO/TMAO reductase YedYZ molybdopterin-dependent catalytic subunit
MAHERYPKWVYTRTGKVLVANAAGHKLAGECWESPADVPVEAPVETPAPSQPTPPPAPVLHGEMVAAIATESDRVIGRFHAAPARLVIERVSGVDSIDELREISAIEGNRPQGARKTVMAAVSERIAALSAAATPEEDED